MSYIKCSTINHVILIHDTPLAVYTRDIKTAEHIVAMAIIAKMIEKQMLTNIVRIQSTILLTS